MPAVSMPSVSMPSVPMPPAPTIDPSQFSPTAAFLAGLRAAWLSVMAYVLIATYVGIAALAHDFGFSLWWLAASTVLVWAGPAQVILVSTLGAGTTPVEAAIAVSLSSVRLLPMVISLLPLLKGPQTRNRDLLLPAHLTAVTMWIEALRLLPGLPRENRIPFSNGLGLGFMLAAQVGGCLGYYLATSLPPLLSAALLFLTPMSFLLSTARNAKAMMDKLALVLGLLLGTILTATHVQLDLMWTGIGGGTLAYVIHRLREATA